MLIVGQFAVSIALLVCTAIIFAQTTYVLNKDMGYQKGNLLLIHSLQSGEISESARLAFLEKLRSEAGVTAVAQTSIAPATSNKSQRNFQRPGRSPQLIGDYYVGPNFFATMGTPLIAGREFSEQVSKDQVPAVPHEAETAEERRAQQDFIDRGLNIILNETAVKELGFASAHAAIGQTINADLIDTNMGLIPAQVIGVVKDTQFRSAREPLEPMIFINNPRNFASAMVRFQEVPGDSLVDRIQRHWRATTDQVPFFTQFVDERVQRLYKSELREGQIFGLFAVLTILVACLGLFGLAAFTTQRRTKEIGIRKVLGARSIDLVKLLAWQFTRPVIIANLIAWPVAWWVMRDWLNGFSDRIDLNPAWFLAAGLLALAIALATTIGHAIKVARANPIHALRYE